MREKATMLNSVVKGRTGLPLADYLVLMRNAGASIKGILGQINGWLKDADLDDTISIRTLHRYLARDTRHVLVRKEAA